VTQAGPQPVLSTTNLSLRIRGATIVDDVSLNVNEGELLVIIGPNGAGKTTLFNLLSGVTRPTSGRVVFGGFDITAAPPYVRARRGMGRTFQTSTIFAELTTLENARLAAQAHLGGSDHIWELADHQQSALDRARGALAAVGLEGRERVKAASLSHGEKRKLDLAILLCGDPKLVLLDEPTAGIAVEDVGEMMTLIRSIHRDQNKTVLMVEHRMDLIMGLADRMAVMHHGSLLAVDTPERIIANEIVQSAYLGDPL
jgi:branched-chain amino acid transport system ATP-binding protein